MNQGLIGQVITGEKGKYRIVKFLGEGGFGITYLAEDLSNDNSKCAVKRLKDFSEQSTGGKKAIQDFHNEYKVLKKIDHDRVPKMIDFFTCNLPDHQGESRFLVQEYIEGDNLRKEFKNNQVNGRTWNQAEMIEFLMDILEILAHLQNQTITGKILIHRDIKPENLIRRKLDKRICLIDFGLVKLISSNYSQKIVTGLDRGSYSYMAPEQKEGRPSFYSDIYSVGLVAIEGLIGKHPLSNCDTTAEVKWQNLLSKVNPKISSVLIKMVKHDPTERYQFARDVLYDIQPLRMLGQSLHNEYYRIRDYLGSGQFGNTYLAEEREENKTHTCVIKQLKFDNYNHLKRREAKRKFKKEVNALRRLENHDQIPEFIDDFEELGENHHLAFYLVQEYIEGEDIRQELLREKSWNQNQVIEFLKQLLEILNFIHENNVIHCDIKPSNIMRRSSDGKFVLIDFGSVKKAVSFSDDFNQSSPSTQSVKTRCYMSPEQAQGNEQYNSDIYALGITAIQALTGKEPNQLGLRDKKTGKYNWSENIQVDNRLVRILDKMVAFDPVQSRYNSAQEVLNDLRRLKGKNIVYFQSPIKRKFWIIGMSFGAIFFIMLLSWAIFIDDSSNKKRNIALKLRKEADELISIGQPEKATEKLEEAYKSYQKLIDSNPKDPRYLIDKAYILSKLGKFDKEYLESCNNAQDLAKELAKKQKKFLLLYAETYNCIAVYHQEQGEYEKADDNHKIAIKEYEKVEKENSNSYEKDKGEIRQSYAEALNNRGQTFKKWGYQEETKGNNQTAIDTYKLALEFFNKSLQKIQENKQLSDYNSYLETDYNKSLGEVYFRQGKVHKKMSDKQQANLSFDNSQKFYSNALKLINENYAPLKAVTLLGRARVYLELENKNFKGASEDCEDIRYLAVNLEIKGRAWICLAKIARSDPEPNYNFQTYKTYKTYKDLAIETLTEAVNDCKVKNTSDKTCEELKKLQRNVEQDILDF
ncbi:protein kinase domain-containing protein [Dapis sp. BLCC M126]|uniref:protein kinase domain-containing protein n=1 Tax=Dapis sp. BLCC M126 TaxID=3400189 RepID=UPI003CF4C8DA